MADRYFVETPITGETATIMGAESSHLAHVMRAKPGDRVLLFDGSGAEFSARIERVERRRIELTVLGREEVDRELPIDITLGVSLPKGDRQRWLVEKATELGVGRIVPLRTARSVAKPTPKSLDRLRRTVIEASKQCGRNRLMEISPPIAWPEFLSYSSQATVRLLAHPRYTERSSDLPRETVSGEPVRLAVGPEGGFTEEEVAEAVRAGWHVVDLGPRILRVETAALLLAAQAVNLSVS